LTPEGQPPKAQRKPLTGISLDAPNRLQAAYVTGPAGVKLPRKRAQMGALARNPRIGLHYQTSMRGPLCKLTVLSIGRAGRSQDGPKRGSQEKILAQSALCPE
jgi:hypothetical protein